MKKFTYGFLNMGFTLAGSLVVYLTLSGTIQKIAGVSTILAFAGAMYLHMKEPESE
jgi:ATP-dependent helicase/DNAse subunit B